MDGSERMMETAPEYIAQCVRLTLDDYRRLPSGLRYELVEGVLRQMTPSPSMVHQEICKRLARALLEWVEDQDLGKVFFAPADVVLSEHNVVQPDLFYVSRERLGIIEEAHVNGAPDLVVEVLSPGTAEWDRITKRRIYGQFGVRELWLVDPGGRSVEVAVHDGRELATVQVYQTGASAESQILKGFALDVDRLFR